MEYTDYNASVSNVAYWTDIAPPRRPAGTWIENILWSKVVFSFVTVLKNLFLCLNQCYAA